MNRTRVWFVVSPVVAAGVLTAHWLAYRLTSTPTDPFHGYSSTHRRCFSYSPLPG